jgi:hypothetical protein
MDLRNSGASSERNAIRPSAKMSRLERLRECAGSLALLTRSGARSARGASEGSGGGSGAVAIRIEDSLDIPDHEEKNVGIAPEGRQCRDRGDAIVKSQDRRKAEGGHFCDPRRALRQRIRRLPLQLVRKIDVDPERDERQDQSHSERGSSDDIEPGGRSHHCLRAD